MELKEKLVSSFMAFEDTVDVHSPIHDIRTEAIRHLKLKVSLLSDRKLGSTPP